MKPDAFILVYKALPFMRCAERPVTYYKIIDWGAETEGLLIKAGCKCEAGTLKNATKNPENPERISGDGWNNNNGYCLIYCQD